MSKCNCNAKEMMDSAWGCKEMPIQPKQPAWDFFSIAKALWNENKWYLPEGLAFNRQEFRNDKLAVVVYDSNYWALDTGCWDWHADLVYRAGLFAKPILDLLHWRLLKKIKARKPKCASCRIRISLPPKG